MPVFDDVLDFFGDVGDLLGEGLDFVLDFGDSFLDLFGTDTIADLIDLVGRGALEAIRLEAAKEAADAALRSGATAVEIREANAAILEEQSDKIIKAGDLAVRNAKINGIRTLSKQKVQFLKSGVSLEGTPLLVLRETNDLIIEEINLITETAEDKAAQVTELARIERMRGDAEFDDASFKAESILTTNLVNIGSEILGLI